MHFYAYGTAVSELRFELILFPYLMVHTIYLTCHCFLCHSCLIQSCITLLGITQYSGENQLGITTSNFII